MNKKVKLFLLILVNAFAWGYVAFKIFGVLQGEDEPEINLTNYIVKPITETEKKENQVLSLNYADPFLKNYKSEKNNRKSSSSGQISNNGVAAKPITAKTTTINTVMPTLEIKYLGLVKNNDKGTQTALLTINGKSVFAKVNDVVDGVVIKQITPQEIIAIIGKQKLVIKK
jgi:hypothetical protein